MRISRKPAILETSLIKLVLLGYAFNFSEAAEPGQGLVIDVTKPVECTRRSHIKDVLHVHYRGFLEDGTVFDESYIRGAPFSFELGRGEVIAGWDQGLQNMCIGEERRLTIPPWMAYGFRGTSVIPGNTTIVFETKLMAIDGVKDVVIVSPTISSPPLQTASPTQDSQESGALETLASATETITPTLTIEISSGTLVATPMPENGTIYEQPGVENGECRLLGPFALIVQSGLGLLALFSLVWKRWRERPRRHLKVWFFDVSKQVFGSVLLHMANLVISIFSSGEYQIASKPHPVQDANGHQPNPCSFYLINIAVDTTIGIPILVIFLRILHHAFSLTPLARPPESIKSGNYGQPPHATWWLKQSVIYFIGLLLMKLCVFGIFEILPWIAWVGDWALRWTEGNEALQIAFVMFLFPLCMNALQYWIIDSFIKDKSGGDHQAVPMEEDVQDEARQPLRDGEYGDDSSSGHDSADAEVGKQGEVAQSKPVAEGHSDGDRGGNEIVNGALKDDKIGATERSANPP